VKRIPLVLSALAIAASMLPIPAVVPNPAQDSTRPGQPVDAAEPDLVTHVFTVRHKNVDDVYLLISPYLGPRGSIQARPYQRTLAVTDAEGVLRRIAGVISAYDIPPRTVQVAVQLILATSGQGSSEPAPPPIRGVIEKLNALNTRWKDYRLLGNASILGTEGEGSTLRVGDDYRVMFRVDRVSDEDRLIRFKPFELQRRKLAVEGAERYASIMNTMLNLRDSQLFIVGASKMEQSNRALFMTITASLQQR
jgi:hypothetical protein